MAKIFLTVAKSRHAGGGPFGLASFYPTTAQKRPYARLFCRTGSPSELHAGDICKTAGPVKGHRDLHRRNNDLYMTFTFRSPVYS